MVLRPAPPQTPPPRVNGGGGEAREKADRFSRSTVIVPPGGDGGGGDVVTGCSIIVYRTLVAEEGYGGRSNSIACGGGVRGLRCARAPHSAHPRKTVAGASSPSWSYALVFHRHRRRCALGRKSGRNPPPRHAVCVYYNIVIIFIFTSSRAYLSYCYYTYAASGHCSLKTRTPRPQFVRRTDFQKYNIIFTRNTGAKHKNNILTYKSDDRI